MGTSSLRTQSVRTPSWWARPVGWLLAHVLWNTQVLGRDNLPATGPVVLAANHTGFADGPLVFAVAGRPVHMLVKASMFRWPLGAVLRRSGQIPVDPSESRAALVAALGVLRCDGVVGLFPEGRRGRGDLSQTRAGAAWLALNAHAPVVPVAVLGTRRTGERVGSVPGPRRRLVVEFGAPVRVVRRPGVSGKQALEDANDEIRRAIQMLLLDAVQRTGIELPEDDPDSKH